MVTTSVTLILVKIIGAVALLLWGTRMVKLGFTRAYATSLRKVIAQGTSTRFKAFLAGLGVTAVLQSSTATALVTTSFASKGMITTAAGISVMIGADVSTTLVAQVLTFDLKWIMPVLLFTGVVMHHFYEHSGRRQHLAKALIGLGLILLSLSLIKESALPLAQSETLPLIMRPLEQEPLLALFVAALMTWMLHSSLAAVLIIASLASGGLITMSLGLLLVLGANLGGALIPFAATYKMGPEARRITTANLIMRVSSIFVIVPFLSLINMYFDNLGLAYSREIVHFHTFFNVLLAIIFLPLVTPLTTLCTHLNPDRVDDKTSAEKPLYLDAGALESPTIALAGAARETLRMAEMVEQMFVDSMTALKKEDIKLVERIRHTDDCVDALHTAIKIYLTRVNEESLDPRESDRFIQILTFSTNLEHVGDIIESSIADLTLSKISNHQRFSDEGFKEIKEFHKTILQNMKIAQAIFMSEDPKLARQLVDNKKSVRIAEQESTQKHFQRLRSGVADTMSTSALHTDILRDYRRINSYITTVAYAILDNADTHRKRRREDRSNASETADASSAEPPMHDI